MSIKPLIKSLRRSGVKIAFDEAGYMEPPPPPPHEEPIGLWDQYKVPALATAGTLLAGYGLHRHFEAQDAEKALQAASLPANATAANKATKIRLGLTAEDAAKMNARPEGLLNRKPTQINLPQIH